jgi:hypothetical protein
VQAQTTATQNAIFGWKTSPTHWRSDAVFGVLQDGSVATPWKEVVHPETGASLDLSFKLTTYTNTVETQQLDFGDAPRPYPTLLADNGARHQINPKIFLGNLIDAEADGQPDPLALGDDNANLKDEDGVAFTSPLVPGLPASVTVTASANGLLNAWIDFQADGSWAQAEDQVFTDVPLVAGPNNLTFTVPATAKENVSSFGRFRFSTVGKLSYVGAAPDGEVEDYQVKLDASTAKWVQWPDGSTNGLDVRAARPMILASDFVCKTNGLITQIQLWGSWLNDAIDTNAVFQLSFWSDVPAGRQPPYSHPGRLLWRTIAQPGQYRMQVVAEGPESFFDPNLGAQGLVGSDKQMWRYDFTIPALQAFRQTNGTIYWLAVSVKTATSDKLFGWKTSLIPWNDDAVYGHVDDRWLALGDWRELRHPRSQQSLDLAFALTTTPATKVERDDYDNSRVQLTLEAPTGEQSAVQLEGSSTMQVAVGAQGEASDLDGNGLDQAPAALVSLDVAGTSALGLVRLGLDASQASLGQIEEQANNTPGLLDVPPFTAVGSAQSIFDVSVEVEVAGQVYTAAGPVHWQGTLTHKPFAEEETLVNPTAPRVALLDATGKLTGYTIVGLTLTPNARISKWYQPPDVSENGLDVQATLPKALADDFKCSGSGPITDLHVWGSWLNDLVDRQVVFNLGIWSDASAGAAPSRPGILLWRGVFTPGQYNSQLAAQASERFYDPSLLGTAGASSILGSDTAVWRYDFYVATNKAFWQTNGQIYWLSVQAQTTATQNAIFGWKTSPTHWRSDAVFGVLQEGTVATPWKEVVHPETGASLDLSFKLTTTLRVDTRVRPRIISVSKVRDQLVITWATQAGQSYRLQYCDQIQGAWMDMPGEVAGNGDNASKADSLGSTCRFYRILCLP